MIEEKGDGMNTDGCQSPTTKMQKRVNQDIPRVVGEVANALKGIMIVEWEGRIVYLMKKTSKRIGHNVDICRWKCKGETYPLTTRKKGKAPQGGGR